MQTYISDKGLLRRIYKELSLFNNKQTIKKKTVKRPEEILKKKKKKHSFLSFDLGIHP